LRDICDTARNSIDTSLYYIDFTNIQISKVTNVGTSYNGNAGTAKSEGVEFSVTARPLTGLALSGWVDYDEAVLTQTTPPGTYGLPGFPLPFVSRWSGNVSAQQDFPLVGVATGFVAATASYVSPKWGQYAGSATAPPRQYFPPYAQLNVRIGARSGPWSFNIFANNVTERRALLGGGVGDTPNTGYVILPPRIVGLNVSRSL